MKRHLTENEIDFLVFGPEELSSQERQQWTAHIQRCSLCRQHHDLALQFRDDAYAHLAQGERRDDAAIADRIAGTSLALQLSFGSLKPPDDLLGTAVERSGSLRGGLRRFVETAARHPVRTAAAGLLAAALVIVTNLLLPSSQADLHSARIQNGVLTALDMNGNELWSRPARGMPEGSTDTDFIGPEGSIGPNKPLVLGDIHSRGGTELLVFWAALPQTADLTFSPESLYCFAANGDLLWTRAYRPGGFNPFMSEKRGSWRINRVAAAKFSDSARKRAFVCIFYAPFSPGALLEIDGETGQTLQEYSHFGYLNLLPYYGGSKAEKRIIIYGTNNAYSKPFLAVLDPDRISGFGPTPKNARHYGYSGESKGSDLAYVVFPRTFLGDWFGAHRLNEIDAVYLSEDGSFVVQTREFPPLPGTTPLSGHVLYSFDSNLRLVSVTFSDPLQQSHKRLIREGHALRPLDSAYAEELKNAVEYWNGTTFVRYRDMTHAPLLTPRLR